MQIWKWVGLAGVVGATAAGVAVGTTTVRRRRREFVEANPDELRSRLLARHELALARSGETAAQ